MKTFIVHLHHVVGDRSFGQTLLVEVKDVKDVVSMILDHEISSGMSIFEDDKMWMDSDYYIEIDSLNEVNTFDELKNSMFTLR